jgi:hypothetical protein
MHARTVRKAALAAVIPVALTALTACGGSTSSAVDPAAHRSQSQTRTVGTVDSAAFLKLMKGAAAKITTVRVAMTGDSAGQQFSSHGVLDLSGAKPAMQMSLDMGSSGLSGIQMRLVDGVIYVSLGSMTQGKFVKFDLSDPNSPLGSLSSSLDQLDPGTMMNQLSPDVFRHVRYLGSGSAGRHYHAVLVTAKAPQLKGLPASATANLPKTMSYDAWLDSQGRFRKFMVSVPKFMTMTATYTDYGADVHVTAPPASQITAMPGAGSSL